MATVLYTTAAQIRAVLSLSEIELEDKQLTDMDLATPIEIELTLVYPTHAAAIAAADASDATSQARLLGKTIALFCAYQGAVVLLSAGQFLVPQKVSDGDAEVQRFEKDDLEKTIARITAMRDYYRSILNPTLFGADVAAPGFFTMVPPSYDPVTNDGATA